MAVDVTQIWLICLAVSAPIAGVVGFAVQLRTVKNLRLENENLELENEKLELEIENLEREKKEAQRRIVIPTTEEVEKYNDVLFSRRRVQTNDAAIPRSLIWKVRFYYLKAALKQYAIYFLIVIFLLYLIFDVYRVSLWLWGFL